MADIVVSNHGSIFVFEPHSDAARQWLDEEVESEGWQWFGESLCVSHGYALDLAQAALDAGLEVV